MPPKTNPHGSTTETVSANVRRVREARGYSQAQLSDRLAELGHTIPTIGVRRIENLGRGISVDDLVSLAAALGVSPASLLVPEPVGGWTVVDREITGHPEPVSPRRVFRWLTADTPLDPPLPSVAEITRFRTRSAVCDAHLEEILAASPPADAVSEMFAVAQGDIYPDEGA